MSGSSFFTSEFCKGTQQLRNSLDAVGQHVANFVYEKHGFAVAAEHQPLSASGVQLRDAAYRLRSFTRTPPLFGNIRRDIIRGAFYTKEDYCVGVDVAIGITHNFLDEIVAHITAQQYGAETAAQFTKQMTAAMHRPIVIGRREYATFNTLYNTIFENARREIPAPLPSR